MSNEKFLQEATKNLKTILGDRLEVVEPEIESFTWKFPVRKDYFCSLKLPMNLTKEEADRLSRAIKSFPIED